MYTGNISSMGQQSEPPKALLPKEASDADTQKDKRCAWVCA